MVFFHFFKLSYDNLPLPLKQCFAYFALFPKDYEIEKKLLVQLWMAQGYIESSYGNEHLEDIGNQYFEDLLSRSLFGVSGPLCLVINYLEAKSLKSFRVFSCHGCKYEPMVDTWISSCKSLRALELKMLEVKMVPVFRPITPSKVS